MSDAQEFRASVNLAINPLSDDDFHAAAHAALNGGANTPGELAARLRDRFPLVLVQASCVEGYSERWYVYREGRWTSR